VAPPELRGRALAVWLFDLNGVSLEEHRPGADRQLRAQSLTHEAMPVSPPGKCPVRAPLSRATNNPSQTALRSTDVSPPSALSCHGIVLGGDRDDEGSCAPTHTHAEHDLPIIGMSAYPTKIAYLTTSMAGLPPPNSRPTVRDQWARSRIDG